ncbi:MAG: hypothetical protein CMM25_07705 [Rhodospirillaceae bacterium]|nr:hypothetical protein [Rhodospirillaceae bacterium]
MTQNNIIASRKYRNKNPEEYRCYQREYKMKRYNVHEIRVGLLKAAQIKYYYKSDPLPCIRKLWVGEY